MPELKDSAKQLMKLLRGRALVFSTLPRSIYMASHMGGTWDNPTSQHDFEKMADLKGLSELLKSPNTTFGHSLCLGSDNLVEYLIQRIAWIFSIAQAALAEKFSFDNLDHIDLCLILIFKDDYWSRNVHVFREESKLWHYAWDFVYAFNPKGPKPVWPHHAEHLRVLTQKKSIVFDPTYQFPALFKFKSGDFKVKRTHLAPWDDLASLKVTFSKSDIQTSTTVLSMSIDKSQSSLIDISPPLSSVEASIRTAFQRLFFPHNLRWYCVGDYYFSQPMSKTTWGGIIADLYLPKFGIQFNLSKEPQFRKIKELDGKKEYTAVTMTKKQMDELFKDGSCPIFLEKGWANTIIREQRDEFPFLSLINVDTVTDDNNHKLMLKIKDLRLEQCLPFFKVLYRYYGLSKRRFTMMCQLPFKALNDTETKFYSELSALRVDTAKSKDFDNLESMLKKAGLDRTQGFSNVELDPSDAYYMLAERCYEINVKKNDLAGIAKAYLFFEKVHAHNIYYSYARYKMAGILFKYPNILAELSVFSRMLSNEKIKKKSLRMVYVLLFNLCSRYGDEEFRYMKAYRLVCTLLSSRDNPGLLYTFNAQTKAAFKMNYQLDEKANFPDIPGVNKKAEAESTKNILKMIFLTVIKNLLKEFTIH